MPGIIIKARYHLLDTSFSELGSLPMKKVVKGEFDIVKALDKISR